MHRTPWVASLAILIAVSGGCPTSTLDDDDSTPEDCDESEFTAPEIAIVPIEEGQPTDFAVPVFVEVLDDDGVNTVLLYHRTEDVPDWNPPVFLGEFEGQDNVWTGEIPAIVVQEPGVDWYIQTSDAADCQAIAYAPGAAPEEWFNFSTEVSVFPIPVAENFDSPNCTQDIDDFAWTTYIGSFPQEIHAWKTDARGPLSGECSAFHSEGIPGGSWECPVNGVGIERDNWLISPALDFTTKESIAVRWFERHRESGICDELHELYVSTGSPNVEGPDWQLQETDLPLPGSAWQSSAWYDLTEFAGQERVYLGLRYLGGSAGRWQIDDFYVGEPLADLVLSEDPILDEAVEPGTTGIELALSIINVSDLYPSPVLTATLSTGDDDLLITTAGDEVGEPITLPALDVGASAPLDAAFVFEVLPTHADNAYLDFGVTLDDGDGHTWPIPIRMLMGQESYVTVTATTPQGSEIDLELGYGPIVAPTFSVATNSELQPETPVDVRTWRLDITEHARFLPPGPGDSRWYLEWENDTPWTGTVDSMVFEVGGVEYSPDELPTTVEPLQDGFLLFPRPPVLVVESFETDPEPAAPGVTVALQDIVLRNDGEATAAPIGCIAGSTDPDATNFSAIPVAFGTELIEAGGTASAVGDITFDLASAHTNNADIDVILSCTDGFDAFTPSLLVPVPYPRPTTALARIDDPTGNNDGYADPGETVDVFITVLNDGEYATNGPVTATFTPLPNESSATFVTATTSNLTFGGSSLDPDASVEADSSFALSVDASNLMGDSMVFDVVYTAGGDVWNERFTIEVTGLPWNNCNEPDDPLGDVFDNFAFDIKGCASRSDGQILEIRLDSWTPYNPANTAVWFLMHEVPSVYSIEWVPPGLDFETGCIGGTNIPSPTLVPTVSSDGMSSIARLDVVDLNEIGRNIGVAFGTGFCSGANGWCDTYPAGAAAFAGGSGTCNDSLFIPISW